MSNCWKCGWPVADGRTECEYGCGASRVREPLLPDTLEEFNMLYREIDWSTIESLADLIKVLSVIHGGEGVFADCGRRADHRPNVPIRSSGFDP